MTKLIFPSDNYKARIRLTGSYYQKNGVQYIKFDESQVKLASGPMHVRFENLFNGQKALEDVANNVINQNSEMMKGEVFPPIEKQLAARLLTLINIFLSYASFDELFPRN